MVKRSHVTDHVLDFHCDYTRPCSFNLLFCANNCFFPLHLGGKFCQSATVASKLIPHEDIVARLSKMGISNVTEILPAHIRPAFERSFDVGIVDLDHKLPDCMASMSRNSQGKQRFTSVANHWIWVASSTAVGFSWRRSRALLPFCDCLLHRWGLATGMRRLLVWDWGWVRCCGQVWYCGQVQCCGRERHWVGVTPRQARGTNVWALELGVLERLALEWCILEGWALDGCVLELLVRRMLELLVWCMLELWVWCMLECLVLEGRALQWQVHEQWVERRATKLCKRGYASSLIGDVILTTWTTNRNRITSHEGGWHLQRLEGWGGCHRASGYTGSSFLCDVALHIRVVGHQGEFLQCPQ